MRGTLFPRTAGVVLLAFLLVAVSFVVVAPAAQAAGGDYSLDFVASEPGSYDHSTGGGAFDDRTIGIDVVESLEGGDFSCGDTVTYLTKVTRDSSSGAAESVELNYKFGVRATNGANAGHILATAAAVNYGPVSGGDGAGGTDSAIADDGGSTVTLSQAYDSAETPSTTYPAVADDLFVAVFVDDLEPNETVVIRVDVLLGCGSVTKNGNIQAAIDSARVVGDGKITVGQQTVPFKRVQLLIGIPGLLLVKTASPATYSAVGETISYSYLVTNTGNVSLAGPVTVSDDKATAVCPAVSTVGNNDGFLDPSESITCSASYTITQADLDAGSVTNIAFASADGTVSPKDTKTVTAVAGPALLLDKTASPATYDAVGDVIGYSYLLTNSGNVTLSGPFTVTDDKSTDESCPATASLAPGASITCSASYTITQADLDAGSVTNTAQGHGFLGAAPVDSNEDFETVRTEAGPGLSLDKTASPATYDAVGDVIGYSYLLTNSGNVTVSGPFTVTDDKATVTCPSTPTSLAPSGSITCSASYTITQADLNAGSVTNIAQGFAWVGESQIASNKDSETVNRRQTPPPPPPPPALGSIGNLVWEDRDADNVQDPGEPGVPGVVVELHDANTDALLGIRVTDAAGQYLFEGLEPGDYYLVFILPNGDDTFVIPNVGGDSTLDSDADNLTVAGRTPVIKVLGNAIDNTWDAGVVYVEVGGVQIATTTPETLPFTGADLGEGDMAGIALALLAMGGVALLAVRRREGQTEVVATGWSGRLWDVE